MFDDDLPPSSNRPATRLLSELESIKGALSDGRGADDNLPTDIPLLDDMVIHNLNSNADLLNIEQIFNEDTAAEETAAAEPPMQFPSFTLDVAISDDSDSGPDMPSPASTSAPQRPRVRPDYSREVLIQEIVDEFIPQIEVELQKRLRQLDDAALRRLKDSK